MINNSPWLWHATQTAANMTGRNVLGIDILQGKRKKGLINPSQDVLDSEVVAGLLWPVFRSLQGFIRQWYSNPPARMYRANAWYQYAYKNAANFTVPGSPAVTYAAIKMTSGVMTPTAISSANAIVGTNRVDFSWNPAIADSSQTADDVVVYAIRNERNGRTVAGSLGMRSDGGSGVVSVPTLLMEVGDDICIYMGFTGAEGEINFGTVSDNRVFVATAIA
jgi:hypothetical protein